MGEYRTTTAVTDTDSATGVVLVAARNPSVMTALQRAHHEVATVDDGIGLCRTLEDPSLASAIDVVVAEIELGGCSALDVLSNTPRAGRPPVVLLTPSLSREVFARARAAGAFAVLHEPIVSEHLCAVVAQLVRGRTPNVAHGLADHRPHVPRAPRLARAP